MVDSKHQHSYSVQEKLAAIEHLEIIHLRRTRDFIRKMKVKANNSRKSQCTFPSDSQMQR